MIERYSFHERLCHWLSGFTYLYCLSTGLAFYSPYLFWIAIALGGAPTSRFWHPIVGLTFLAATLWMHSLWRGSVAMAPGDRNWLDHTGDYVTHHEENVPPQGRFNAGQKLYYWAMYYGALILLITGVPMWIPEYMPIWLRPSVILLHESAALVTIGAFIIHVYMSVFLVPGSLHAMISGKVSPAWAKANHRLWYDEVAGSNK
jgi:formate dehydrogenase subunit gamma